MIVNVLLNNCKQNITSLSYMQGTTVHLSIEANSVVHCLSTNTDDFFVIGALGVNKCELGVYTVTNYMKCKYACAAQTAN